jgi:hypothetical protein
MQQCPCHASDPRHLEDRHLEENLAAGQLVLNEADLDELSNIA